MSFRSDRRFSKDVLVAGVAWTRFLFHGRVSGMVNCATFNHFAWAVTV